jgi:hypothetical protein
MTRKKNKIKISLDHVNISSSLYVSFPSFFVDDSGNTLPTRPHTLLTVFFFFFFFFFWGYVSLFPVEFCEKRLHHQLIVIE